MTLALLKNLVSDRNQRTWYWHFLNIYIISYGAAPFKSLWLEAANHSALNNFHANRSTSRYTTLFNCLSRCSRCCFKPCLLILRDGWWSESKLEPVATKGKSLCETTVNCCRHPQSTDTQTRHSGWFCTFLLPSCCTPCCRSCVESCKSHRQVSWWFYCTWLTLAEKGWLTA